MMKNKPNIKPIQTNKEFIEAAGIDEQDAFLAVTIRRIVARLTEIPARELVADMTFDTVMKRAGYYTDWDSISFAIEFEELFEMDINSDTWEEGQKRAQEAGYSNWFYNPDNYVPFSFLWKPFCSQKKNKILFGEWVKLTVEVVLVPIRDKISTPNDWPGLESSDLESDSVAARSPSHNALFLLNWGCFALLALIAIGFVVAKILR